MRLTRAREVRRTPQPLAGPALVGVLGSALPALTPVEQSCADMYVRLYPRLCDFAERLVGYDAARDAVHGAMLELWRKWTTLMPEERSDGMIVRTVHFHVLRELRRNKKYVRLSEALERSGDLPLVPAAAGDEADLREVVDGVIAQLPPRCREVYMLVHDQGFTYREAAEALDIGFESAKTHMKRANLIIREALKRGGYSVTPGSDAPMLPRSTGEGSND